MKYGNLNNSIFVYIFADVSIIFVHQKYCQFYRLSSAANIKTLTISIIIKVEVHAVFLKCDLLYVNLYLVRNEESYIPLH